MSSNLAPQLREIYPGEEFNLSVDFSGKLDEGEMLTGTPTAQIVDGAGLTFAQGQTNQSQITLNNVLVPIAHAVQFSCTSLAVTSGDIITVLLTCSTSASQSRKGLVKIKVT